MESRRKFKTLRLATWAVVSPLACEPERLPNCPAKAAIWSVPNAASCAVERLASCSELIPVSCLVAKTATSLGSNEAICSVVSDLNWVALNACKSFDVSACRCAVVKAAIWIDVRLAICAVVQAAILTVSKALSWSVLKALIWVAEKACTPVSFKATSCPVSIAVTKVPVKDEIWVGVHCARSDVLMPAI